MRNLVLLLLLASPAYATTYTFSGDNGLSGSFYLDDSTPLAITVDQYGGIFGQHSAPLNQMSFSFGGESFDVPTWLVILDMPHTWMAQDGWIIRASTTGQTPYLLSLFIWWTDGWGTMPMSLAVPPHLVAPYSFQYTFAENGNYTYGQLFTLEQVQQVQAESVQVPELPSVALLVVGLAFLATKMRSQL